MNDLHKKKRYNLLHHKYIDFETDDDESNSSVITKSNQRLSFDCSDLNYTRAFSRFIIFFQYFLYLNDRKLKEKK